MLGIGLFHGCVWGAEPRIQSNAQVITLFICRYLIVR